MSNYEPIPPDLKEWLTEEEQASIRLGRRCAICYVDTVAYLADKQSLFLGSEWVVIRKLGEPRLTKFTNELKISVLQVETVLAGPTIGPGTLLRIMGPFSASKLS